MSRLIGVTGHKVHTALRKASCGLSVSLRCRCPKELLMRTD
jgi:hypothetical protein